MNRISLTLLACSSLLFAACSGGPPLVRSYTLTSAPIGPAATAERIQFRFLGVNVPERLNSEILIAQSHNGAAYELVDEAWAAPLPDELRNAISADLTHQLPGIDVTYIAAEPQKPVYRLRVAVQNFLTIVGEQTDLTASWSISGGDQPINCVGSYSKKLVLSNAISIQSYRELTKQLSDDIAQTFRNYRSNPACP